MKEKNNIIMNNKTSVIYNKGEDIKKEFKDRTRGFNTISNELEKAFLVYFDDRNDSANLKELEELANSAFLEVVCNSLVVLREINPATYIGSGKVEEFSQIVKDKNITVVIFDVSLSGSQIRNLQEAIGVKVIDRNMLILDIFASRAKSAEGKLQVELAQLKYILPRLSGITGTSGRFGSGGVGMRGPGETKLEIDKRKIQENIVKLERELKEVEKKRGVTRKQRLTYGNLVCLVGYTNAGKSTLMNKIANADAYADDRLFATLDVLTKRVWDNGVQYILSDTVGFVSNLPHALMNAFSATLEECKDAQCLLVVVDSSDFDFDKKFNVVINELNNLNIDKNKIIIVYNKIDKISEDQLKNLINSDYKYVCVSAKKDINIDKLKSIIRSYFIPITWA